MYLSMYCRHGPAIGYSTYLSLFIDPMLFLYSGSSHNFEDETPRWSCVQVPYRTTRTRRQTTTQHDSFTQICGTVPVVLLCINRFKMPIPHTCSYLQYILYVPSTNLLCSSIAAAALYRALLLCTITP